MNKIEYRGVKMDRESLSGNILIFLISAIMIFVSIKYLGHDNMMVGITGLFLLIAIVNKDFSKIPIRSILKISFLTGFIGFVPYLVNLNIWTGFFINFLAIFIMIYLVVYTLNKTIYFPFLFGYTLLLFTNVTGTDLRDRVVGMIVVGMVAVIFRIILAKISKKKEIENSSLLKIIDSLIINISNFSSGEIIHKDFDKFKELSTIWSRDILEKRNNSFYLSEEENIELNLIASLEHIGNLSLEFSKKVNDDRSEYRDLLLDISILLSKLKGFINKAHGIENLDKELIRLNEKYSGRKGELEVYEILESLRVIDKLTDELVMLRKSRAKTYKILSVKEFKSEIKESIRLLKGDFNKNSVRFIFAFRTALLVAGAYFIVRYFDLALGKWMVFTITSVSQPYNNTVKNRAKGRIIGTLVGAIIYLPLSMVFVNIEPRIVILAIAVFFMINFKNYAYSTAMLTVFFLGVVTIDVKNIMLYAEDRIFFVVLGVLVVLIGNKIIFPYSLEKETNILVGKYHKVCGEILEKTMNLYTQSGVREEIKRLIIIAKGFENKMIINNTALDSDLLREFRNEQRMFLSNIHNILNRVEYSDNTLMSNGLQRMERIKLMKVELESIEVEDKYSSEKVLNKYIQDIKKLSEKLIYLDVYEMIKSYKKSGNLKKALIGKI
ncbi:MAG: FUSC family protein [Sarcina sp.]